MSAARRAAWFRAASKIGKSGADWPDTLQADEIEVLTDKALTRAALVLAVQAGDLLGEYHPPGCETVEAGEFRIAVPRFGNATITASALAAWLSEIGLALPEGCDLLAWLSFEAQPRGKKAAKRSGSRLDRLAVAMEAGLKAYRAKYKADPTAGDLWDWLAEHDETGTIEEITHENKIVWRTSKGALKDTTRKAFENRLTGIRARNPG